MAASDIDTRRLAFFAAAEPLFERFGLRKTTVEEICRAVGASKRTFYELFADKVDLARRLLLHHSGEIVIRVHDGARPDMGAVARFDVFLDAYVGLGREHPIFRILMQDAELLTSFSAHAKDLPFAPLVAVLQAIIEAGIRAGTFRPLDAELATWLTYSVLDNAYYLHPAYRPGPGPFDDPAAAREVRDYLLHALLAGATPR